MKITDIELVGFDRFKMGNFKNLTAVFNSPLQLILGSNGSGKSALMYYLVLLKPNSKHFEKNGSVKLTVEHKDSIYIISTIFDKPSGTHSFTVNGEEMNPGGTGHVQTELIESELGLTKQVQQILSGKTRFTEMGPNAVMGLMLKLSDFDSAYIQELFNNLSQTLREEKGVKKHLEVKIEENLKKLSSLDAPEDIDQTLETVRSNIAKLNEFRNNTCEMSYSKVALEDLNLELISHLKRANELRGDLDILSTSDFSEIIEKRIECREALSVTKERLERIYIDIAELHKVLSRFRKEGDSIDLDSIRAEIEDLKYATISSYAYGVDPMELLTEAKAVSSFLTQFEQSQGFNIPEYRPSSILAEMEQLKRELEVYRLSESSALTKLSEIMGRHNHAMEHGVNCSNCGVNVSSSDILNESRFNETKNKIEATRLAIEEVDLKLEELTEEIKEEQNFQRLYLEVHRNISGHKHLCEKLGLSAEKIFKNFNRIAGDVTKVCNDCNAELKRKEKLNRYNELKSFLKLSEQVDINSQSEKEEKLLLERDILLTQKDVMVTELKELDRLVGVADVADSLRRRGEDIVKESEKAYLDYLTASISREALDEIMKQEAVLVNLSNIKNSKDQLEAFVSDLESDSDKNKTKVKALGFVLDMLSPNTGIIARNIRPFIESFINEMNEVMDNVFPGELEILPYDDPDNITYRFRLKVKGEVLDGFVGDASRGQKELIDFAFNLVLMWCLDLNDYPLFMDEVGVNFDDVHRQNLMNYVRELLEIGAVSQVFMISHFSSMHGGLANYESLVLSRDNLHCVPDNSNKHVSLV